MIIGFDLDVLEEGEAECPASLVIGSPVDLATSLQQVEGGIQAFSDAIDLQTESLDLFLSRGTDLAETLLLLLEKRDGDGIGVVGLKQLALFGIDPVEPNALLSDDSLLSLANHLDQGHNLSLHPIEMPGRWLESLNHVGDLGLDLVDGHVGQLAAVLAVSVSPETEEVGVLAALAAGHHHPEPRLAESTNQDPLEVVRAGNRLLLAAAALIEHLLDRLERGG